MDPATLRANLFAAANTPLPQNQVPDVVPPDIFESTHNTFVNNMQAVTARTAALRSQDSGLTNLDVPTTLQRSVLRYIETQALPEISQLASENYACAVSVVKLIMTLLRTSTTPSVLASIPTSDMTTPAWLEALNNFIRIWSTHLDNTQFGWAFPGGRAAFSWSKDGDIPTGSIAPSSRT